MNELNNQVIITAFVATNLLWALVCIITAKKWEQLVRDQNDSWAKTNNRLVKMLLKSRGRKDPSTHERRGEARHNKKTMKKIERSKTITYRWWRDGENEIKPEHVEALEKAAEERIRVMLGEGFTSGELRDNVHMTDDDPEDGVVYTGWWDVSEPNDKMMGASRKET